MYIHYIFDVQFNYLLKLILTNARMQADLT